MINTIVLASETSYAVSNKHAFVLPKNEFQFKLSYLKVNDTLDIFNLKEDAFKDLGSIGDMNGYDLELRYGICSQDSIFVNIQRWNVDYLDSVLQNNKYDFFNRVQILDTPHSLFTSLSFDIGYQRNSSDPINISNNNFLNSLISKISPNSNVRFNDGDIVADDTTITLYDDNGNKIYPYISINDLSSDSYYSQILLGKKFTNYSILDIFIGYKYTKITSGTGIYPENSIIESFTKDYTEKNLNRDEHDLTFGFAYSLQWKNLIGEFSYEFHKLFRDEQVSYLDTNHVVDASISMAVTKNFLLFVGGKLMTSQFNTDIPYLYDEYTKTQFDHKYGFAKFGLLYKF